MTDIPANAPRSEDGQWWWDGTQWQPVQSAAAAGTSAAPTITLEVPTVEPRAANDGTTVVVVRYGLTNSGTVAVEAGTLEIGCYVVSTDGAAESSAYVALAEMEATAPGQQRHGSAPIQLDAGSWTVWVVVTDKITGETLATSQDVPAQVAGHRATARGFDDTQAYSLTVQITQFEHVDGSLYRVHYDIQTDRDVPAGLTVTGRIDGGAADSGQIYQLTTGIAAGQRHAHYLTLEADKPSHVTATITADPGGPSEKAHSVEVDITEDGTPTMR
jgi:hypothetical protein